MLDSSFRDASSVSLATMLQLPSPISIDGFAEAWNLLSPNLQNSLFMVIPAALVSSIIAALNGYIFLKWRFRGLEILCALLLLGSFIPDEVSCFPWCVFFNGLTHMARSLD